MEKYGAKRAHVIEGRREEITRVTSEIAKLAQAPGVKTAAERKELEALVEKKKTLIENFDK